MTVMSRIIISAGFIIVAAVAVLATPDKGPNGFIDQYFAWIVIAIMSVAAVLEVKEHFAERAAYRRGEDRDDTDRSVGIAILHSEDGESR